MAGRVCRKVSVVAVFILGIAAALFAQSVAPALFSEMRWRMIGPFRGGRTVAAVGIPSQPNVFYIGVNNGGVWKTTDYGRIWTPIFDDQPTGSIGALAIAPSDPNVLYAGSGEGLQRPDLSTGDGIYRSSDGGKTWQHFGLRDGQQIPAIAIDPRDPNRVFVAVLGHPYGPNAERGIFRSTDGGRTFEKVLYRNENTGAIDLLLDPNDPQVVFAALWESREGPWENGVFKGPNSGLYKSTDGGTTWKKLTTGLPSGTEGLARVGIDIARSDSKRMYAAVFAPKLGGIYRSDDAGESWTRVNTDERLWGREGDFSEVKVDPKNPDVVYVANVVTWKSVDGGKTFSSFRGAPGGDDYHRIWINPNDPKTILIASDQGAIVTVNGGESWSSWYNQPTAQMFHVNADNDFPYRVCGGQQESGSACVQTRSDEGQITFRDWTPVGVEEYGYAVPDPLDPNLVYGGKVSRFDRRTRQVSQVGPKVLRDRSYRTIRTAPLVFSPVDPHILYFAANTLWKTSNGGQNWSEISPDLTRSQWTVPASVGVYASSVRPTPRGVIYTIAPSPLDIGLIWAGTDDGLIHVTSDGGKTWSNVTPPQLEPWAKVSIMDASHFDRLEAYAAVNTLRLDDLRPHIYRTRDGGKTWTHVTNGIPDGGIINVVREDPKTKGLLLAGSEQAVYVSFDDGDHWQSLRLNMPATSIRDLIVHEDDIAVGTHGRGFWILDDIEPLRQAAAAAAATTEAFLHKPARAWRFRWNKNTDTPLPPDEPSGQNPPEGAIIDYVVNGTAAVPVTLEILDSAGNLVRRYSSAEKAKAPADEGQVPWYWIRPTPGLSGSPGMHRFVWDLHYAPAPGTRVRYGINAVPHNTAPSPGSPWVMPGTYTVKLTARGKSSTQPLVVAMDPRVKTSTEGLAQQFTLSKAMYDGIARTYQALEQLQSLRSQVKALQAQVGKSTLSSDLAALEAMAVAVGGEAAASEFGPPPRTDVETLNSVSSSMRSVMSLLQGADVAPTTQAIAAVADRQRVSAGVMTRWKAVEAEVDRINARLKAEKLPEIRKSRGTIAPTGDDEED